jgi:hypothetical protein
VRKKLFTLNIKSFILVKLKNDRYQAFLVRHNTWNNRTAAEYLRKNNFDVSEEEIIQIRLALPEDVKYPKIITV